MWRAFEHLENTTHYGLVPFSCYCTHTLPPSHPHTKLTITLHRNTHTHSPPSHPPLLPPHTLHLTHQHAAQRAHTHLHERMVELVAGITRHAVCQDGCHDEGEDSGAGHASNDGAKEHSAVRGRREAIMLFGVLHCCQHTTMLGAQRRLEIRCVNKPGSVNKPIHCHKDPFGCSS